MEKKLYRNTNKDKNCIILVIFMILVKRTLNRMTSLEGTQRNPKIWQILHFMTSV